jgi:predicted  nucleic acid-binding Zn-ribbon protein
LANFTEKIKIVVDVVTDSAKTGINNFKTSVAEAETTTGKFKSGASSAFDTVKANVGLMAVGAGAALVGFGAKAVGAFTETAKSAIDLSTATGLSVEQASRWIAVGDDFEVSAEALQTGLGKIAKTMDDTKWAKYGIETRDAGGHARDTNDILLDALDTLSKVDNATEQARIGQELFGKGYQSLTPILGHTKDEYQSMLDTVEKGQVINEGEAKTAETMRLAQDQLGDALKDVELAFGQMFAKASPVLIGLAKGITVISNATNGFINLAFGIDRGTEAFKDFFTAAEQHTVKQIGDELHGMSKAADESHGFFARLSTDLFDSRWDGINDTFKKIGKESPEALRSVIDELRELIHQAELGDPAAQKLVKDYGLTSEKLDGVYDSVIQLTPAQEELNRENARLTAGNNEAADSADDVAKATDALKSASDHLTSQLERQRQKQEDITSAERAAVDTKYAYRQATKDADDAVANYNTVLDDHTSKQEDVEAATDDAMSAILDQSGAYATLNGAALDSKDGIDRQIDSLTLTASTLAPGSPLRMAIEEYIKDLQNIPTNINTTLSVTQQGIIAKGGQIPGYKGPQASGGLFFPRPGGTNITVAEAGQPEIVAPWDQFLELINRAGGLGGGGGPTIIQHFPPGISPLAVAKANREYHRRGGRAA